MCSQDHSNLRKIGSHQTKQCLNVYRKKLKDKKELQLINKTVSKKMNKTGKIKSLADYPIWMYQSLWFKIISKVN